MRVAAALAFAILVAAGCAGQSVADAEARDDGSHPGNCTSNWLTLANVFVMVADPASHAPRSDSGWFDLVLAPEDVDVVATAYPLDGDLALEVPSRGWRSFVEREATPATVGVLIRRNLFGDFWMGAIAIDDDRVFGLDCEHEWVDVTEPFTRGAAALGESDVTAALEHLVSRQSSPPREWFGNAWEADG